MNELKIKKEFRDLIPPLANHEKEGLEEDIKHFGCYCPIVTWNGFIIDGHHRYEICMRHRLSFRVEEMEFEDEDDVMIWMIDNQVDNRRNVETAAKIRLALKKEVILSRQAEKRMKSGGYDCKGSVKYPSADRREGKKGKVSKFVAQDAGVGARSVERFKYIEKNAPELADDLCVGKVVEGKKLSIDGVYRDVRKEEKRETLKATEFPKGKYRVIYADPPWSYNDKRAPGTGGAEDQYPTMSLDSICELPIRQIADENAVLFLWATTPLLQEGLDVMKSWGFNYKTFFVWDKVRPFPGNYNSVAQELLLLGTKGSCLPDCDIRPHSIIRVEKGRHSEKPKHFRELISGMYKYGNKVELFARKQTEGWEVYGNECA